jgi:exopolyphosphatase/guanosine-5'-triphosphate,3'-diphosphate pyrophosphatase
MTSRTRVAAIDCGTNSIRLLIADVDAEARKLTDVERLMEVVRLGEGVDRTGRISPEAMARTLEAARRYAQECDQHQVGAIRFVATSASRDASNADEFVAGVKAALGVAPEVIEGSEEAQLSFTGATGDLAGTHDAPYVVVDLGGGSTEIALGDAGTVEAALSVDIGCVRLTERHLGGDPPSLNAMNAAVRDIDAALDQVAEQVPLALARTLVGVAGTVTTITAHALRLPAYDPAVIHGSVLTAEQIITACDELITMTRSERAGLPYMHPGRVDVIGAGALIWKRVVQRVGAVAPLGAIVTSEHDILDGIALGLV